MALRGPRILVIEDDADVLAAYLVLLRLEGAEVAGARTGQDALRLCRAGRFDVVLSDLGLPDIPGDVLIRAIRATAQDCLWVLAVTGESISSQTRASAAGADVVFTKPVEWGLLLGYLEKWSAATADSRPALQMKNGGGMPAAPALANGRRV
jgi:DNA-binding response OmpR family regulator